MLNRLLGIVREVSEVDCELPAAVRDDMEKRLGLEGQVGDVYLLGAIGALEACLTYLDAYRGSENALESLETAVAAMQLTIARKLVGSRVENGLGQDLGQEDGMEGAARDASGLF